MFGSDWSKRPKTRWSLIAFAFATVIAIGVGLAAISYGISKQIEYNRNANQYSAEYASHTYYPERYACLLLPLQNQSNCIAKATDAARNYDRAEQDLVAQKTSALWAFLMGSGAIVGLILSAIGIFLVWTTFNATKESNIIAREIGEAQTRAYIDVVSVDVTFAKLFDDAYIPFVKINLRNSGTSPAMYCRWNAKFMYWSKEIQNNAVEPPMDTPALGVAVAANSEMKSEKLCSFAEIENSFGETLKANGIKVWVYLNVAYNDVFKREHFLTYVFEGHLFLGVENTLKKTPGPVLSIFVRKDK